MLCCSPPFCYAFSESRVARIPSWRAAKGGRADPGLLFGTWSVLWFLGGSYPNTTGTPLSKKGTRSWVPVNQIQGRNVYPCTPHECPKQTSRIPAKCRTSIWTKQTQRNPCGCGSRPMVPFWGRCTTHFSLFSGDWDVGARDFDPWPCVVVLFSVPSGSNPAPPRPPVVIPGAWSGSS